MYTISGSGCRQALCSWIKTILGCNLEWAPTDLSNLLLWLDASQITGLNDGDAVASWTDLSGNGNHATQSTAAAKPTYKTNIINGLPVVRFDGGDFLSTFTTGITNWSMWFVFARGDSNREQVFFAKPNNSSIDGNFFWMFNGGNALHAGFHNGTGWQWGSATTNTITDTAAYAGQLNWDGTNLVQTINGTVWRTVALTGPPATNAGATEIGRSNAANRYWIGDFTEIIVCSSDNDAVSADVEAYLSDKWGITFA